MTPEFRESGSSLLEAEVVDAVDSIAYDTHDLDDALGLGLVTLDDLAGLDLVQASLAEVRSHHSSLPPDALRTAMIRQLLALQVLSLLEETAKRIDANGIRTLVDVRHCPAALVALGERMTDWKKQLERFLHQRVYLHPSVRQMTADGQQILKALFEGYTANPDLLPERFRRRWTGSGLTPLLPNRPQEAALPRVVADYLAGMTDRFAQQEHRRLTSPRIGQ